MALTKIKMFIKIVDKYVLYGYNNMQYITLVFGHLFIRTMA